MRKSIFIAAMAYFCALFVSTGCSSKKDNGIIDSIGVDTLETIIDTTSTDSITELIEDTPMPAAADELFDDFFFNFAASKKVQAQRIAFPLTYDNNGNVSKIAMNQWVREKFFMDQEIYTLILNNPKQLALTKDTTVSNVTVERINIGGGKVTRWHFARTGGLWHMDSKKEMSLSKHPDATFLKFYNTFATDTAFQKKSLAETVSFTGPDPEDDFGTISGEIVPEQWQDFAPEMMPSGTLYNIIYGQENTATSSNRTLMIRGISNSIQMEFDFTKTAKGWVLKKMNL